MEVAETKNNIKYSQKECDKIVDYFMDLRMDLIDEFFFEHEIYRSSKDTKIEIRAHVESSIEEEKLTYDDIVNYLAIVEPAGKQHIILYDGPELDVTHWRNKKYFKKIIEENNLLNFVNSPLDVLPPKTMSISSINYVPGKNLEIKALALLDYFKRKREYDEQKEIGNEEIHLKAIVNRLDRCIITFKWNLVSNKATLHISQLPSNYSYETMINTFKKLIDSFLDLDKFSNLNLRSVIKKLHKLEKKKGTAETRSHNLNYQGISGRTYGAKSPSNEDSVVCDDDLDKAFDTIREKGSGHIGNFYWLPANVAKSRGNVLTDEIHTIILGEEGRINFLTPNKMEDIQYVLSRVRRLSK